MTSRQMDPKIFPKKIHYTTRISFNENDFHFNIYLDYIKIQIKRKISQDDQTCLLFICRFTESSQSCVRYILMYWFSTQFAIWLHTSWVMLIHGFAVSKDKLVKNYRQKFIKINYDYYSMFKPFNFGCCI